MLGHRLIDIAINAPITIALGLLVPYIQKWLSELYQSHSAKRLVRIRKQYIEALMLHADPHSFTHRLVLYCTIALMAVVGIGLGMLVSEEGYTAYLIRLYSGSAHEDRASTIMGYANEIIGSVSIFGSAILFSTIMRKIMSMYDRVKFFEEYQKKVPIEIRKEVSDAIVSAQAAKPVS